MCFIRRGGVNVLASWVLRKTSKYCAVRHRASIRNFLRVSREFEITRCSAFFLFFRRQLDFFRRKLVFFLEDNSDNRDNGKNGRNGICHEVTYN